MEMCYNMQRLASYTDTNWHHRRNNRRDRGRLVTQPLGWGTNNVLVPQLLGRSFQKKNKKNQSKYSHQNSGFSIWVFKNFPGWYPPDPHSGRGRRPPAPNTRSRCWDPNLGWSPSTFQPWLRPWLTSIPGLQLLRILYVNFEAPRWTLVSERLYYLHLYVQCNVNANLCTA